MSDVDLVNHPPHYSAHPSKIETIRITRDLTFDCGNAVKYVMRAPYKGNELQDLEKAQWYIKDAISTGDPIMVAKDVVAVRSLLRSVASFETDQLRAAFFTLIGDRDLTGAADALKAMLDRDAQ